MIIIWDSREQKNIHILKRFQELGIKCRKEKLHFGDYTFEFDNISYKDKVAIERKNSITEICGNLGKGKARFQKEFERAAAQKCKMYLMIEDGSWEKIEKGEYRSNFSPQELKNRLNTWCHSFMIQLDFVPRNQAADYIVKVFQEYIKK
jgi:ERCC4-type nuclease